MSGAARRRELAAAVGDREVFVPSDEQEAPPAADVVVDTPEGKMPLPPVAIGVAQAQWVDGRDIVILVLQLLGYGQLEVKLEPQTARTIGMQLQQLGSASASGLTIASGFQKK